MEHLDDFPLALRELLANIKNLPYNEKDNEKDMEEAYELGRKTMLNDLLKYKTSVVANYGLKTIIDIEKAQEELDLTEEE